MSLEFVVEVDAIKGLTDDLRKTPGLLTKSAVAGLNNTATAIRKESVQRVTTVVRLTENYVDARINFKAENKATNSNLAASVTAPMEGTLLSRFEGTRQSTVSNVWTKAKFAAAFGEGRWTRLPRVTPKHPNKKFPWKERTGNAELNIPKGQKAAGIMAGVLRSAGITNWRHAFFLRLNGGNGFGVFTRAKGANKPQIRYGMSVHQLTRKMWERSEGEFSEQLAKEIAEEIDRQFEKEMNT